MFYNKSKFIFIYVLMFLYYEQPMNTNHFYQICIEDEFINVNIFEKIDFHRNEWRSRVVLKRNLNTCVYKYRFFQMLFIYIYNLG